MATPYGFTPLGYVQLTVSGATFLTPVPAGANFVLVACESAGVRWRDDGVAPTSSIGMPLAAGQEFQYAGNLAGIQFIAQTGSPILDISFYK